MRYQLKTPYRDGTTHVELEPLDFLARLAALVLRPRANLTRYHCVFIFIVFWCVLLLLNDCFKEISCRSHELCE